METENWQIKYSLQAGKHITPLDETLTIKKGYHNALKEFWKQHEHEKSEQDPVYKTRDKNYVELLSLGFASGFTLPLTPRKDLEGAVLLCDCEHPIKLTALDGTAYRHCE